MSANIEGPGECTTIIKSGFIDIMLALTETISIVYMCTFEMRHYLNILLYFGGICRSSADNFVRHYLYARVGAIKIVIVINCNLITFSKVIVCNCN